MFAQFLSIVFSSIKLDKNLYNNNKFFGEAGIYFAGLIMILDGVAGAVAANSIVKTSIGLSGLTAILTWLVWAIFIYVVGVKLFSDKQIIIKNKEIFDFIFNRVTRTYLDLYIFVEKLDKLSLEKKRQLTIPLIKEIL